MGEGAFAATLTDTQGVRTHSCIILRQPATPSVATGLQMCSPPSAPRAAHPALTMLLSVVELERLPRLFENEILEVGWQLLGVFV